ncbi:MAG: type I restriction-modification system subunit M [Acidobacteriota bacterium]|nr:MAG: type I restriction-modification system subunit M [Acidobacteriota bacterium]
MSQRSLLNHEINQDEINKVAWKACDTFRGVVDPSDYKNYILVFLFLKYLSDVWKDRLDQYRQEYKGDEQRVRRRMSRERFVLPEGCDFDTIFAKRNEANIGEIINIALEKIEDENKSKLEGVFRNIDFNSESNLGETRDRNSRLKHLIEDFADPRLDLRPSRIGKNDVIGDTYQFLIERFAGDAGKKGGEFFTPPQVSVLLAKLLAPKKGDRICDPSCGSGSLLIRVADEIGDRDFALYGQESNGSTWALCRMNMFLHDKDSARIEWGDTLRNPKLIEGDSLMKFDIVVANPPFSLDKWGADRVAADRFNRFHRGIPPKSKADFAFITHMIETTIEGTGRVGVIVPHGVLFRGGAEGKIRRQLIEENLLEAVIGLPANLFYGTGIPAAILIFNRGKKTSDVLFIDASREYEDAKNQSRLRAEDIDKITATYRKFKSVDKYAYRATLEEIRENDFNLNIPRYVDTFEEEEEIDIKALQEEIEELEAELKEIQKQMTQHLRELGFDIKR